VGPCRMGERKLYGGAPRSDNYAASLYDAKYSHEGTHMSMMAITMGSLCTRRVPQFRNSGRDDVGYMQVESLTPRGLAD
jgi:hypothetical protein